MREFLEQVLDLTASVKSVYGECERFVRTRLLSVSLTLIQSIRQLVILHDCMMMACFVWALAFFSTGLILCFPWAFQSSFHVHPALAFSAGLLSLASAVIYYCWREETWLKAAGLQDILDALQKEEPRPAINRRELAALMEELLEEKFAKLAEGREAVAARSDPTPIRVAR